MKRCSKCGVSKPTTEFHSRKTARDGLASNCKDCRNAHNRGATAVLRQDDDYRARNVEYQRTWRQANPDKTAASQDRWRQANPDYRPDPVKVNANSKASYERNKEKYRARKAQWAKDNADLMRGYLAKRRAKTGAAPVDYRKVLTSRDDCYLCGAELVAPIHVDHVVPVSRGGLHEESNLQPTHAACNLRKSDKLVSELNWITQP